MRNPFAFKEFRSTWVMQSNIKISDGSDNLFSFFPLLTLLLIKMPSSYKSVIALMQTLLINTVMCCCALEVQQNTMIQLNKRYYKPVVLKVWSVDPWESVWSNLFL